MHFASSQTYLVDEADDATQVVRALVLRVHVDPCTHDAVVINSIPHSVRLPTEALPRELRRLLSRASPEICLNKDIDMGLPHVLDEAMCWANRQGPFRVELMTSITAASISSTTPG